MANILIKKPYPKDYKGVEQIGEYSQQPSEPVYEISEGGFGCGFGPGFKRHGKFIFNSDAFVQTINNIYSRLYSPLYKRS